MSTTNYVHDITVSYGVGPLVLQTTVTVETSGARDSVIAWAREKGYEVRWTGRQTPMVLSADAAIRAVQTEIDAAKETIGG